MRMTPYPTWQRFYFVVDSAATEQAIRHWAARCSVECEVEIPPFGFERDATYCQRLATSVAAHDTTVLIMAVGAPRSEVFVDTHRAILPRCWAFCVGQAVKIELGLVRRAPSGWQAAGLEWLWRLLQEPSRLTKRYVTAAIGFGAAVIADQARSLRERHASGRGGRTVDRSWRPDRSDGRPSGGDPLCRSSAEVSPGRILERQV
jgi:N-acetylglucosaminyldiphosphoundecaprenol N-acetyl-beta-D-mannosaminyltransferase